MSKLNVVHQMADCQDCDWHDHNYIGQAARKTAYQHHMKTGHEVHVETGSVITYERTTLKSQLVNEGGE